MINANLSVNLYICCRHNLHKVLVHCRVCVHINTGQCQINRISTHTILYPDARCYITTALIASQYNTFIILYVVDAGLEENILPASDYSKLKCSKTHFFCNRVVIHT